MPFPSGNSVDTTELASGTGNPATARAQLYALATWFNALVASENAANGVCVLDGFGVVDPSQMPSEISPATTLTLSPTNGNVKIEDVLRLQIIPKATLLTRVDMVIGDIAYAADDITGTNGKLCFYDGTNWRYIALTTLTILT
ncbi:hypothetical protein UFOVP641_26 [uncultured Caudovirales phage]|uniref:Uncharacterized protein n=1 Tax=uncultured Caudovirales phage TaxID=2100421 RepID=A0A6J5N4R0_9CAUD|nr:hypothetical protein UFOVP641_26 [uncultured Caudovirales phage]